MSIPTSTKRFMFTHSTWQSKKSRFAPLTGASRRSSWDTVRASSIDAPVPRMYTTAGPAVAGQKRWSSALRLSGVDGLLSSSSPLPVP